MRIAILTIKLRLPWAKSLKDKRSEVKSLLAKLRGRYNVSAVESGLQDHWDEAELMIATLAADTAQADSIMAELERFVLGSTDAEVTHTQQELI